MFNLRNEKVHPSLGPLDDSSSDEDIANAINDESAISAASPSNAGNTGEVVVAPPETCTSLWQEFVEDFEIQIEDSLGKRDLFMLEGVPMKKQVGSGIGLYAITNEIMNTYGLEFLNIVSQVIGNAYVDLRLPLEKILDGMKSLDFQKHSNKKLFIWIDSIPDADVTKPDISFCHRLVTALMSHDTEPNVIIPCNDFDEEVVLALLKTMDDNATLLDFQGDLMRSLYRIGLSLTLAAENCDLIIIDADQGFNNFPGHHDFMAFVKEFGHQVMYLRDNPTIRNKEELIDGFVRNVVSWKLGQDMKLEDPVIDDNKRMPLLPATVTMPRDQELQKTVKKLSYLDLEESLKKSEILRKLTPNHFILPDQDDYDSTDSEEDNVIYTPIE